MHNIYSKQKIVQLGLYALLFFLQKFIDVAIYLAVAYKLRKKVAESLRRITEITFLSIFYLECLCRASHFYFLVFSRLTL